MANTALLDYTTTYKRASLAKIELAHPFSPYLLYDQLAFVELPYCDPLPSCPLG